MSLFGYFTLGAGRYRERFGLAFEDVVPGLRIRHRPGIDVSQRDNQLDSVDLINNAHLHYDSHYAAQTEWGVPLTVSTMTVQRFMGMISRSWYRRRRILVFDNLALIAPVRGDDTLYSESEVLAVTEGTDPEVGIVALRIRGLNRAGTVVARIDCRLEVYRRGRHPDERHGHPIVAEDRFRLYHDPEPGVMVEQTGIAFDDMQPGETFEHWPSRPISAAESRTAALRSLEINPRWHDATYCEATSQQEQIWEPLILGAVTALTTRTFGRVVANLGWTGIEMPEPMRPGDTLRAESTILETRLSRSRPDQGIATVETRAFANGRLVCQYTRNLLVYRRNMGPYKQAGY